MKVKHLIRKDYLTVNPYSGLNAILRELIERSAIVVQEKDTFYGVLTPNDLINNTKNLIIDCLTIKELIDCETTIEDTIIKMNAGKTAVLPVSENGKFIGLVFKNELYKYLSEYNLELKTIIKERTHELKKSIETRDLMFSIIAHDLKSPFNSILGFTGLLKTKIRNLDIEKAEKLISGLNSQARATYNLLENLLKWASNKTGQVAYNPTACNISAICEGVIAQIKDSAEMKNIKVTSFHSNDTFLFADKNMVETILRNLISNAIKFTEIGGEVRIYSMKQNEFIEITVEDTGIGVDEEDKTHLFSSEFNTSKLGTSNEKGSGLGLVICKDFVKRHQGKIWIENKPEKGTLFKFTMPIYKFDEHNISKNELANI